MKQMMQAFMLVGAVMALTGAAVYITGWVLAPYVYTIGATLFALGQINTPARVQNAIVRRLRRQQIFGALILVLTGAFMLFTHGNEWIVSLTIAAILQLYTSIRIFTIYICLGIFLFFILSLYLARLIYLFI